MSYQVLARKWRPSRFEDLVGQSHVARALINALDHDRLHHAFLFTGTRGVGKTTIARILAKSLNCEAGVSSKPCGECLACREVDEGRFVDLIEVDAASRTKVDDTRELLDNVQYAPTRGRYKVYLIDEVHMLSGHSFNALLKTLEEPPPHVKFLLATTDPQKLPVTVLSRCLQFHLKRLSPELIRGQLEKILTAEKIVFDAGSTGLLSRSADGSLRDALSLLDQAIAFGGGKVTETDVRDMLGSIDDRVVDRILSALADGDAPNLLAAVSDAHERNIDSDGLLNELLLALHGIAFLQVAPGAVHDADLTGLQSHAGRLSQEDVQLFYQIGLIGRRDLHLAPDSRTGLEMTLLRMLAFRPLTSGSQVSTPETATRRQPPGPAGRDVRERAVKAVAAADTAKTKPESAAPPSVTSWSETVATLNVTGLTRELAQHSTLSSVAGETLALVLDRTHAHLLNPEREQALRDQLSHSLGRPVALRFTVGQPDTETPARERQRNHNERQQAATEAVMADPAVRSMQEQFNARVTPGSIRPKN